MTEKIEIYKDKKIHVEDIYFSIKDRVTGMNDVWKVLVYKVGAPGKNGQLKDMTGDRLRELAEEQLGTEGTHGMVSYSKKRSGHGSRRTHSSGLPKFPSWKVAHDLALECLEGLARYRAGMAAARDRSLKLHARSA